MTTTIQSIVDKKNYDVLATFYTSEFLQNNIVNLFRAIKPFYRSQYGVNERIILVDDIDNTVDKQFFYNYFQRLVNHLDITNCFVLVVGNHATKVMIDAAHSKYNTNDLTQIEFVDCDLPTHKLFNITNFDIPDSICVNPWINVELTTDEKLRPCCIYQAPRNSLPDVSNISFKDGIADPMFKQIRQQMLTGESIPGCNKCQEEESAEKTSKRQQDNYVYRNWLFDIDWNQTESPQLISLDLKLKNLCNLSCRICNPTLSSKWYDEVSKNSEIYSDINLKIIKSDWRTDNFDEQVWKDFSSAVHNIKYVTFAGGEPLLDKSHVLLLNYFVDNGLSKDIDLHYNSNGTIYAKHLIPIWDKFKSVEISFSIDNVEHKFNYERYGSNWETVVDCLVKYQQLDNKIYKFNIYATLSILNILDSYELYKFSKSMSLPIVFNILDSPAELSVAVLNQTQKQHLSNTLVSIDDDNFYKLIQPVLTYIQSSHTNKTVDDLVIFLQRTDKVRGQDFTKVYPQLFELLNRRN